MTSNAPTASRRYAEKFPARHLPVARAFTSVHRRWDDDMLQLLEDAPLNLREDIWYTLVHVPQYMDAIKCTVDSEVFRDGKKVVQTNRNCERIGHDLQTVAIEDFTWKPMRVIEVNMERSRNEGAGETGDLLENPPTNGIVRHDSHLRKSCDPTGD
ncbi:hypothetical protein PR048_021839 [Dryococelus australis]|uniref:Uncharacterized protein n=1 Tax=Dryococelus australis TaxID=614101 RepID=A0ABQ9GZE1_9NEOP|nr:hypothetical protein PR048_021839 [Dryococelus australis]